MAGHEPYRYDMVRKWAAVLLEANIPPPLFDWPWVIKEPPAGSRAFTHLQATVGTDIVTLWTEDVEYDLVGGETYILIAARGWDACGLRRAA